MIDSSVFAHNLKTLLNIKEATALAVDEKGLLHAKPATETVHPGFFASLFDRGSNQPEQVLNATCQRLFDEIIKWHPVPLTSTSKSLSKDRVRVGQILKGIEKIGNAVLNPQLKSDLTELSTTPETLEARLALRQGVAPVVLNKTISGTYIMRNRQEKPWGIFKPQCQEVGGSKNPSWVVWAVCTAEQWGIESGTGYLRECAAYSMDKDNFSNVPLTIKTHFQHPTLDTSLFPMSTPDLTGSFQLFKDNCKPGHESLKGYEIYPVKLNKPFFSGLFSLVKKAYVAFMRFMFYCGLSHLPVRQIHRMAILDIRLLNCDRHLGNFLYDKAANKIHPIDHGLILPAKATRIRFDWKKLVQAHMPFGSKELAYIESLDAEEDEKQLRKCGITNQEALERMKLSTALLKECAKRGMTAHQIAELMLGKVKTVEGSYFEDVICRKVFRKKENVAAVIDRAIQDYLK